MNKFLLLIIAFLVTPSFSGCLEPEDKRTVIEEPGLFDFDIEIPDTTWYHYAGGINALDAVAVEQANITANLTGNNIPYWTQGSYYSIGMTTFEPTMGITSNDNLYMTSWGNGPAGSTAIVQCSGLIEMKNLSDYNCENVYDPISPVPNSNYPYVYVDKWTDRIMKIDMHSLAGMTVEWSDNDGASWSLPTFSTSYSVDHQIIGSSPYPAFGHPTTWVYCVNGNWEDPLCSTSFDGGLTWSPEVSGTPLGCNSGGLGGHIEGAGDGNFYHGNIGCSESGYSIYRSTDGGFTWTEHPLPTEVSGTADTWNFGKAQVAIDDENNVHAMWMGLDNMPYYAYSRDQGNSWSSAMMIAPPIGLQGTGFPVVTAGSEGRVAFGYVGDTGNQTWNGYMTILTDAFSDNPLFTTVQINSPDDPLDSSNAYPEGCGYERCGGLGEFIDIVIDQYGRPWFGLAHNDGGEIGILGTFAEGPSLRGEGIEALTPLPLGGPSTL